MTRNSPNLPKQAASRAERPRAGFRKIGFIVAVTVAIIALSAGCATASPGRTRAVGTSDAESSLAGKTWLLAGYTFEGRFIPLEPGHGSTAKLVFRPDGTLAGFTGTNAFSGTWRAGKTRSPGIRGFAAAVSGLTKKASPNEVAARFEEDFLRELAAARAIAIKKDSIQLLDGRDGILLRFIAASANGLY